jgi:tol-pal system beta propeller repeat protein TolB
VSDRDGSDALFVMRSDGSGVHRLTENLPPVSHPSWSPDGQRIAFNAGSPADSDVYLINIDGSGLRKITRNARANFYPTWSPDGSRLAFSSNRDGDWDIYVMNADGSRVRQLVDSPGLDDKPQWSPDGTQIGFATTRTGFPQLMAVDPDTGEEQPLVSEPINGLNPAWSLDGSQLAFNVVTPQGFDIDVMSAKGEDRRSIVRRAAHLLFRRRRIVGGLHRAGRYRSSTITHEQPGIRWAAGLAADSALEETPVIIQPSFCSSAR